MRGKHPISLYQLPRNACILSSSLTVVAWNQREYVSPQLCQLAAESTHPNHCATPSFPLLYLYLYLSLSISLSLSLSLFQLHSFSSSWTGYHQLVGRDNAHLVVHLVEHMLLVGGLIVRLRFRRFQPHQVRQNAVPSWCLHGLKAGNEIRGLSSLPPSTSTSLD